MPGFFVDVFAAKPPNPPRAFRPPRRHRRHTGKVAQACALIIAMVSRRTISRHDVREVFEVRKGRLGRDSHVASVAHLTVELETVGVDSAELRATTPDSADEPSKDERLTLAVGATATIGQHRLSLVRVSRPRFPWAPLSAHLSVERIPCTDEAFAQVRIGQSSSACHPFVESTAARPGVIELAAPRQVMSGPNRIMDVRWKHGFARVMVLGRWHIEADEEARLMAGREGPSSDLIELVVRDTSRPADEPLVLRVRNLTRWGDAVERRPFRWPDPPVSPEAGPGQATLTAHGGVFSVDLGQFVADAPFTAKTITVQARWLSWVSSTVTIEVVPAR
jgi:hypothetical protein